jgi:hypothetical protein
MLWKIISLHWSQTVFPSLIATLQRNGNGFSALGNLRRFGLASLTGQHPVCDSFS